MMERLHQWAQSWVFKLLLAVIMLSLLIGGFGGYFILGRREAVAIVNGHKIDRQEFTQRYQHEKQRLQEQQGDTFSSLAAGSSYLGRLKQQIVELLINQQLWLHYVNRLGLQVSDRAINTAIREQPSFQKEGKFDTEQYQTLLQKAGWTPERFWEQNKQQQLQQQLRGALVSSEFVLPEESQRLLALLMQQREVRLATLAIEPLISQQILKAGEAEAYYEQHLQDFISPERLKVRYVPFSADALQVGVAVSEPEIECYYQQHATRYTRAARQRISLIRLATAERAEALLTQLKSGGGDFAALAKAHSTDTLTAAKGGELGWIEAGSMDPVFDQAAFALQQPGELSGVVHLEDGYYLLRLQERQPEQLQPLQQVHSEIQLILRQRRAVEQFNALQQQVQQLLHEQPEALSEAAAATAVTVQESDWFSRDTAPSALDFTPVIQTLFDQEPLPNEQSVELINLGGDQAVVVQVVQRQVALTQPFEQVASQVTRLVQREKAVQAARQQAETLLSTLREQPQADQELLKRAGLTWSDKQVLTRQSLDPQLTEIVFAHPKPTVTQPAYGLAENGQGDIVLFELLNVTVRDHSRESHDFPEQLLEHTMVLLFDTLQISLRQQATIKKFSLDSLE